MNEYEYLALEHENNARRLYRTTTRLESRNKSLKDSLRRKIGELEENGFKIRDSLHPVLRVLYEEYHLGNEVDRKTGKEVNPLGFWKSFCPGEKIFLLGDRILEDLAEIEKSSGKQANLTYIPGWNSEHDDFPGVKNIKVELRGVGPDPYHFGGGEGVPCLRYLWDNKEKTQGLGDILMGKVGYHCNCDDGGLYRVEIIGERKVFPSQGLLRSFRALSGIMTQIYHEDRERGVRR